MALLLKKSVHLRRLFRFNIQSRDFICPPLDPCTDDEVAALYDAWDNENGRLYTTVREKGFRFQVFRDKLRHRDDDKEQALFRKWVDEHGKLYNTFEEQKWRFQIFRDEQRDDDEVKAIFEAWAHKHGKVYETVKEKEWRFEVFRDKLSRIDKYNYRCQEPGLKIGPNQFSDWTMEELQWLCLEPPKQ